MRIAFISRMVNREGGIQVYVWELAKRFAVWGHEVHLFTHSCPELPHESIKVHRVPMFLGRSYRQSQNPWVKAAQIWSFGWFSRKMVKYGDYDIIHVQGDSMARAHVRTAHSCHKAWMVLDLSWDSSLGNRVRKWINPLHTIVRLIEWYDYIRKGTDHVIAVSESVRVQMIDNYRVDSLQITVIPNGVPVSEFHKPDGFDVGNIRCDFGIPVEQKLLVFVGWEFGRKGLGAVIDALAKVSVGQPHLVVVGGDHPKDYIEKAEALDVGSRIHFVGAQDDIRPYLWVSDLFVFPTRYEPFGFVIIEAMAAGLPLITSRIAGAAEWIEEGKEGILLDDPFDSQELAQALDKLLEDADSLTTMGKAAQAKAREFEWDRVAEMTLEAYQLVL